MICLIEKTDYLSKKQVIRFFVCNGHHMFFISFTKLTIYGTFHFN